MSILLHLKTKNFSAFHLIIISINSTDMMCGLYLMMILIADGIFQDNYIANDYKWRDSISCYVIFTISLIFSFQSPLTISLMTFSRVFVVISPFSSVFHDRHFIGKLLIVFLSILMSIFVLILKKRIKIIPKSLCLPFIHPENSVTEIKIIIVTVAAFQALLSFFIFETCAILIRSLLDSETKARKSKCQSPVSLLLQLVTVTLSNLLSWIPSNIVYLSSIFICLTSLTRAKCGVCSTLCWKIPNISGSIELFAL